MPKLKSGDNVSHEAILAYTKPSRIELRERERARSVERRKVQRAAKARAKAMGSVWDEPKTTFKYVA